MNESIFGNPLQKGDLLPPAELVSPPSSHPLNSKALLWTLTLAAFLGGTYYGYLFRKSAAPVVAQLMVVDNGHSLVVRWNGNAPGLATLPTARLKVNSGVQQLLLPLDQPALRRGEFVLDVDRQQSADVELVGQGLSGRARYLAGDPLDAVIARADAVSLKQQLADQKELNTQMERRLASQ